MNRVPAESCGGSAGTLFMSMSPWLAAFVPFAVVTA
ncbi:hypothetical protein G1C98_0297 [Bifidobacterium sp. DSM 109960]|uniref:Uncharacterized protein n=1 Tax=Bifidobacterium erythrocebi TaxID=2675325 RepID=A0A7Y0EUG0_9BIFI|nr:hypothetical protein [Bifidobacterium sp. DSM 109960]